MQVARQNMMQVARHNTGGRHHIVEQNKLKRLLDGGGARQGHIKSAGKIKVTFL
jgi:hypothetical protein